MRYFKGLSESVRSIKQFHLWKAGVVMLGMAAISVGCMQSDSKCIYSLSGTPDARSGWTFLPSEKGKTVYIPFEGYYESKGGRIQSPKIKLDKEPGKAAFSRLRFQASAPLRGYWWVDFFDAAGKPLPDINSALYASEKSEPYDEVFFADARAESVVVAFVTEGGAAVKDVQLSSISPLEAADWCDRLYARIPQGDFQVTPDAFALLPGTKAALNTGKPWKILMLGDSIVNDTWTSNFQSLVMRDFPKSNLSFLISVRGSTGCWYYRDPANFQSYVADFKPDLVMIGGISNNQNPEKNGDPEKNMISVIEQCRAIGSEVVVMSPPPSWEWRASAEQTDWSEDWKMPHGAQPLQRDYQRRAARKTQVAYWDLTTAPCDAISRAGKPLDWFRRDAVHNNDRGKQLIGRNLAAWFRVAREN